MPTVGETLPGYEVTVFNYVVARAGTPRPIIERMSREIAAAVRQPDFVARNAAVGVTAVGSTPEELGRRLSDERAKWREVTARAGIRLE